MPSTERAGERQEMTEGHCDSVRDCGLQIPLTWFLSLKAGDAELHVGNRTANHRGEEVLTAIVAVYFILEGSAPTLVYADEVLLRNVSSSSFSVKTAHLVLGRAQLQGQVSYAVLAFSLVSQVWPH